MTSFSQPFELDDTADRTLLSFDDFYRDGYPKAVRLAVVLTGSASAAEDVVQDVMAGAHQRWNRIRHYDEPNAWLRRAIVNRAISRHRRAVTATKGFLRLISAVKLSIELVESDWELWRHVRSLPARQAQMIALVYVEGLTIELAAHVLAISVPTAKSHLARAKETLQRNLSDWRTT